MKSNIKHCLDKRHYQKSREKIILSWDPNVATKKKLEKECRKSGKKANKQTIQQRIFF